MALYRLDFDHHRRHWFLVILHYSNSDIKRKKEVFKKMCAVGMLVDTDPFPRQILLRFLVHVMQTSFIGHTIWC